MNKKQYNNVIEHTLDHEQTVDSLGTARAIFDNMGVALPQGDIKTVYETIKTNNYMGWKSCTMQEAQAAADKGTAAIGISEDRIVVLSATDEEQPVTQTASVITLDENTSAYAVAGLQYYSYSYGTTTGGSTTASGGSTTTTIPINYCGGSNYRDVTKHNMVLQSDGYYVCTRCGYRAKSPELEDQQILSNDDYLKVFSCLMFYSYIEALKHSAPQNLNLPITQNTVLQLATEIRQKSVYKNRYDYSDSNGKCVGPDINYNSGNSTVYFSEVTILNIGNYNGLTNSIHDLVMGIFCPEVSLVQDIIELLTHQMNAIDFSALVADVFDYSNISTGLSIASAIIEAMDTNVSLDDIIVYIDLNRYLQGHFIFSSDGKFKMVKYQLMSMDL